MVALSSWFSIPRPPGRFILLELVCFIRPRDSTKERLQDFSSTHSPALPPRLTTAVHSSTRARLSIRLSLGPRAFRAEPAWFSVNRILRGDYRDLDTALHLSPYRQQLETRMVMVSSVECKGRIVLQCQEYFYSAHTLELLCLSYPTVQPPLPQQANRTNNKHAQRFVLPIRIGMFQSSKPPC